MNIKFGEDSDIAADAFAEAQRRVSRSEARYYEIKSLCEAIRTMYEIDKPLQIPELIAALREKLGIEAQSGDEL